MRSCQVSRRWRSRSSLVQQSSDCAVRQSAAPFHSRGGTPSASLPFAERDLGCSRPLPSIREAGLTCASMNVSSTDASAYLRCAAAAAIAENCDARRGRTRAERQSGVSPPPSVASESVPGEIGESGKIGEAVAARLEGLASGVGAVHAPQDGLLDAEHLRGVVRDVDGEVKAEGVDGVPQVLYGAVPEAPPAAEVEPDEHPQQERHEGACARGPPGRRAGPGGVSPAAEARRAGTAPAKAARSAEAAEPRRAAFGAHRGTRGRAS